MELSKKDMLIMMDAHREIDEELVDDRKGVPQTRYIIEIKADADYFNQDTESMEIVPEYLEGYWMQYHATDNRYESARDLLKEGYTDWVKCKPVQVIVDSWEELC